MAPPVQPGRTIRVWLPPETKNSYFDVLQRSQLDPDGYLLKRTSDRKAIWAGLASWPRAKLSHNRRARVDEVPEPVEKEEHRRREVEWLQKVMHEGRMLARQPLKVQGFVVAHSRYQVKATMVPDDVEYVDRSKDLPVMSMDVLEDLLLRDVMEGTVKEIAASRTSCVIEFEECGETMHGICDRKDMSDETASSMTRRPGDPQQSTRSTAQRICEGQVVFFRVLKDLRDKRGDLHLTMRGIGARNGRQYFSPQEKEQGMEDLLMQPTKKEWHERWMRETWRKGWAKHNQNQNEHDEQRFHDYYGRSRETPPWHRPIPDLIDGEW